MGPAAATLRRRGSRRRKLASAALIAGVAGGFVVATAAPAFAHAVLEQTTPVQGSEVRKAPTEVSLHFGEGVGIDSQSIKVTDASGMRVDKGDVHHPEGDQSTVVVDLKPGLAKASYAVTWHVVSADSHPVGGTFTFGYDVRPGAAPTVPSGPVSVRALHYVGRFSAFCGLGMMLGGTVFLVVIWPAGAATRRARRLIGAGWLVTLLSAALLFLMEGPYGQTLGLGATFHRSVLSSTFHERYGQLMIARIWLLLLVAPAWRLMPARRTDERRFLAVAGLGLLLTYSLAEHSGQGIEVPLAATDDVIHLASVSIWLGGLAMIVTALVRQPATTVRSLELREWSRLASTAVILLVLSGAYLTWRNVGMLPALWSTDYGRLLLIKWWGLVLLLALGNLGRMWVLRWAAPGGTPSEETTRRLRASVSLEVMIGVCLLAAAAALINSVPGRQSYAPAYTAHVKAEDAVGKLLDVRVHLSSTKAGPVSVTADVTDSAEHDVALSGVTGDVAQIGQTLEPVRFTMSNFGLAQGHGSVVGVVIPTPGQWQMILQIVTEDGDDYAAAVSFTINAAS
ncbi:MAG TPA: copper resistance protein CopC [Mycobacteriales bacterium]|nr:copper resistance protein CopC [Mycobacteriales bacterium]